MPANKYFLINDTQSEKILRLCCAGHHMLLGLSGGASPVRFEDSLLHLGMFSPTKRDGRKALDILLQSIPNL